MRLAATILAAILSAALGAAAGLYLAMWVGGLASAYEPGAYAGLLLTIFVVPLAAIVTGWVAAMLTWQAYGRSRRAA